MEKTDTPWQSRICEGWLINWIPINLLTYKWVYHLKGFHMACTLSTASAMVMLKSGSLWERKWLNFHNGQYQLKASFILYADF